MGPNKSKDGRSSGQPGNEGEVVDVQQGIKITIDPKTGALVGVPKDLLDYDLNLGHKIDEKRYKYPLFFIYLKIYNLQTIQNGVI